MIIFVKKLKGSSLMNFFLNAIYCLLLLAPGLIAHTYTNKQLTNKIFTTLELYPVADPYREDYLQVSDLHTIYYAEFGNPQGLPVLILHGGPGAGCDASSTALFDLSYYRVIMVDQRAAMRSKPFAEMQDN